MALTSHYADDFTANLPEFSKSICLKLDELIHQVEPGIEEGKKWGSISYWTESGLVCGFYATKEFVTFTFYNGASMKDAEHLFKHGSANATKRSMKFTSVSEVNSHEKEIALYIREAVENSKKDLNTKKVIQTLEIAADFKKALEKEGLVESFKGMTYSKRKEYVVWIEDAKKEETRQRRIEKALEHITKGLGMYEKYKS